MKLHFVSNKTGFEIFCQTNDHCLQRISGQVVKNTMHCEKGGGGPNDDIADKGGGGGKLIADNCL